MIIVKKAILTPNPYRDRNFQTVRNAVEILREAGVAAEHIDISPDCTMCMSDVYYSHRATGGKRGVHGGGIGIR